MKAIERIYQYIEYKGIKPIPFEKEIGLSNGYLGKQLKRNADLGESIFIKIIENCLDMSPLWLLTGKGEMIKTKSIESVVKKNEHINDHTNDHKPNVKKTWSSSEETYYEKEIQKLESEIRFLKQENNFLIENKRLLEDKIELLEGYVKILEYKASGKQTG